MRQTAPRAPNLPFRTGNTSLALSTDERLSPIAVSSLGPEAVDTVLAGDFVAFVLVCGEVLGYSAQRCVGVGILLCGGHGGVVFCWRLGWFWMFECWV